VFEWLEFEEKAGRFWNRWISARSASYPEFPAAAVTLASIAAPLGVFFRAGGGPGAVAVSAIAARTSSHRLGLRQRLGFAEESLDVARLDEEALLLPPKIALFNDPALNRDLYFWLAALLGAEQPTRGYHDPLRQDLSNLRQVVAGCAQALAVYPGLQSRYLRLRAAVLKLRPARTLPPVEAAIEAVICHLLGADQALSQEAQRYLDAVQDATLSLREFRATPDYRHPLPVPLWATLGQSDTAVDAGEDDDDADEALPAASGEVKDKRQAQRRRQDQTERNDPLVFNRFEKILSFAEMVNVNRLADEDEDSNARDNAEEMDELTVSPHQQRAASRLKIDLDLAATAVDETALQGAATYPEWNYRKQCHLPSHCRVLSGVQKEAEVVALDEQTQRRIRRVRQQFEALRPRRVWLRGQVDGNELDMDALVRARCDLAATGEYSDGLYLATRAEARDLAVSILIDVSLSTDAWVEDRRVIDIEKEALLVLAHGLATCGDDYSIQSFTSHRRHRVWVNTLKDFDEPMSETTERRIHALMPGRYTRMGAAIRHCAQQLARRPNRHRLLLVISDGKPNDSDYYEGRYAVEDTRRAILEARQQELTVFGITIDRDAQQYIAHIFGRGRYAMVHKPEHLSLALPRIYQQLVAT